MSVDLLKDIEDGFLSTLNGTRYLLVEFPMLDIPFNISNNVETFVYKYIPFSYILRYNKIVRSLNETYLS